MLQIDSAALGKDDPASPNPFHHLPKWIAFCFHIVVDATMVHGPHEYCLTTSRCIYCRKSGVALTDEHIVPLGLGGSQVIKKASCFACNRVTGSFEQKVLRGLWGDARIAYNAPTRRKKERRNAKIRFNTLGHPRDIDPTEFPAPMVFYKMGKAGFLQGIAQTVDLRSAWRMVAIHDVDRHEAWLKKYGEPPLGKFKHVPAEFGRMIAKIGYCQTLTVFGINEFRPICLPYILGDESNISYIVGGTLGAEEPPEAIGYRLRSSAIGSLSRLILLAHVRLIANNSTPNYHVVVGEIVGEPAVRDAIRRVPSSGVLPLAADRSAITPDVWPLPMFDNTAQ